MTVPRPLVGTVAVLAALALMVAAAYAFGAGRSGPRTQTFVPTAADDPAPGITVNGVGKVTGTPDTLLLTMGVETRAATVGAALEQANKAVAKVSDALKANGVAAKDIQTSGLNIYPQHSENGTQIVGYNVSESLTAKLRDLQKAGEVISAAVAAGGNAARVHGVSLDLEGDSELVKQAREAALRDARERAEQYAAAAGKSLGDLVSISEMTAPQGPPIPLAERGAYDAALSAVPIEPGSKDVTVTVTAVWALR